MNQTYLDTARLLTQVAPLVFTDDTFALKGGTAINLFVRDMPRLSVDLDLVFQDYNATRDEALARIKESLAQASTRLAQRGFRIQTGGKEGQETKLFVRRDNLIVKVEANYVMRGTVAPVRMASLTSAAQAALLAEIDIRGFARGHVRQQACCRVGSTAPPRSL